MKNKKVIVYPKLPSKLDLGFIRLRGSGLANCMFVASRAYILAKELGCELLSPTWLNFSLGPYLRKEKDKRHYNGLFKSNGITGLKKIWYQVYFPKVGKEIANTKSLLIVDGLGNYFEDLLEQHQLVKNYIWEITNETIKNSVANFCFTNKIGIHVRLGDFKTLNINTQLEWYQQIISELTLVEGNKYEFVLFSDGSDQELKELLKLPNVSRLFTGSALGDILALSKCKAIIGSDSTFSGWGAFLGQIPVVFPKRHFGKVLKKKEDELVFGDLNRLEALHSWIKTIEKNNLTC